MKPCREIQPLLLDRVAGVLPPESAARLAEHLETCLACRAESKALGEALSLAALAPVSEAERQALDGIAGETLRAWRKDRPRRSVWRGLGAGMAIAAAAAAALVVVPVLRHGRTPSARPELVSVRPEPIEGPALAWQEPDLDAVWEASGAVVNGASDDGSDETPIFADDYDPDSI